jgi:ABC-type nitrate/sulfonate/bicarbonate transport system ATPase subunit
MSGCGKTTLLNILSGLERDYEGSVSFTSASGAPTSGKPPVIAYMFQEPRLLPWLTVRGNLRFVLDAPREEAERDIQHWLARVGLAGYQDYFPSQLSVGMQQRVAVARALILRPDVLFMDEPFSSLDEMTALRVRQELLDLWEEQGCTVVFVTHNPLEAVYLADKVVVMTPGPGRILEVVDLSPILPRPRDIEDQRLWETSRQIVRLLRGVEREHQPSHH